MDDIHQWLKSSNLQQTSRDSYENQVRNYYAAYNDLSVQNVVKYLNAGQGDNRCYHRKYAIKSWLKYLRLVDKMSDTQLNTYLKAMEDIKYKIKDRRKVSTLELNRLEHLIKNMENEKLKLILMIAFDTASRIRAILKLKVDDIKDFENKKALVLIEKGDKTTIKLITDETYLHLNSYVEKIQTKYIFMESNKISNNDIQNMYFSLLHILRKESKRILGEQISFHWIRRGAGIYWYNKTGGDLVFVQKLLNHTTPTVTTKYLQLQGEQVRKRMKLEKRSW